MFKNFIHDCVTFNCSNANLQALMYNPAFTDLLIYKCWSKKLTFKGTHIVFFTNLECQAKLLATEGFILRLLILTTSLIYQILCPMYFILLNSFLILSFSLLLKRNPIIYYRGMCNLSS